MRVASMPPCTVWRSTSGSRYKNHGIAEQDPGALLEIEATAEI
jgi:hypothetical protein